jgi:uncharacterized protein (TIGR00369 family)
MVRSPPQPGGRRRASPDDALHRRENHEAVGGIDMPGRRDIESLEAQIGCTFEQMIPFNRVLGLKIDSLDPHAPRLRFEMRPELVGNPVRQILHGGVISATLDVVGGLAIALASLARNTEKTTGKKSEDAPARHFPNIGTIDLRIDYLRPGRGKFFVATGRVVRLGGRVAVAHTELVNESGEQIATGSAAYIVG